MAFLVWDQPGGASRAWPIDRGMMVVGGSRDADIAIPHASVAARQALLTIENGSVRVTALADGCAINGASLTRDMPSTLELGDLLRFGNVTVEFAKRAPIDAAPPPPKAKPQAAKPKPKPAAKPQPAAKTAPPKAAARPVAPPPVAGAPTTPVWKIAALALAFLVVILLAILAAVLTNDDEPVKSDERTEMPESERDRRWKKKEIDRLSKEIGDAHAGIGRSDDEEKPATKPQPKPKPKVPEVVRGIPPTGFAALAQCPDLLELDDGSFVVARVLSLTSTETRVKGRDGRTFAMPAGRVARVHDRADLARRVGKRKTADSASLVRLAHWCRERYANKAARELVAAVLAREPSHPEAQALQRAWAGE